MPLIASATCPTWSFRSPWVLHKNDPSFRGQLLTTCNEHDKVRGYPVVIKLSSGYHLVWMGTKVMRFWFCPNFLYTTHSMTYSNLHQCFHSTINVAIELLMVTIIVTAKMKMRVSELRWYNAITSTIGIWPYTINHAQTRAAQTWCIALWSNRCCWCPMLRRSYFAGAMGIYDVLGQD